MTIIFFHVLTTGQVFNFIPGSSDRYALPNVNDTIVFEKTEYQVDKITRSYARQENGVIYTAMITVFMRPR